MAHLKALPFIRAARAEAEVRRRDRFVADALVRLRTPKGERVLHAEIKRTHLTRALADGFLPRVREGAGKGWILLAPYVGAEIGRYLRENGINYVDAAGNCFLAIGHDYMAFVEGRRPVRRGPRERGIRAPGYQVLFAILAKPDLLDAPVRALAAAAGVGKTAAGDTIDRLLGEGLVGADREGRRLLRPREVLDRWLAGYGTTVRPRLMVGRYRTNDATPEALEERIGRELGETTRWAWGGGAAAMRLTGHYRGPETVLHLESPLPGLGKRLRAIPAEDGPLVVLGVPGPVAFEGVKPGTVHPLLVHAELLVAAHDRAREAAQAVWDRHLSGLA